MGVGLSPAPEGMNGKGAQSCCDDPELAVGCGIKEYDRLSATLNLGVTDGITSITQDGPSSYGSCSQNIECDSCSGLDNIEVSGFADFGSNSWIKPPPVTYHWCCKSSWHMTMYGGMLYNHSPAWRDYLDDSFRNPAPDHPGYDGLPEYGGECQTEYPPGTPSGHSKMEGVVWGWESVHVNVSMGCNGITATAYLIFKKLAYPGGCVSYFGRTYPCGRKQLEHNLVVYECRPEGHAGGCELQQAGTDCSTLSGGSVTMWPHYASGAGVGNGQYFVAGPKGSQCILADSFVTLTFGGGGGGGIQPLSAQSLPNVKNSGSRGCRGCGGGRDRSRRAV